MKSGDVISRGTVMAIRVPKLVSTKTATSPIATATRRRKRERERLQTKKLFC